MPKKGKTLIQPKVRLLLWIYFHEKECNSLSGIAKAIDYGKGNVKTHIIDLLDKGMIKSLSPDGEGPPYKITEKGVAFLKPLLLPRTVGIMAAILLAALTIICFVAFSKNPILMVAHWLPILIAFIVIFVLILILYPYIILRLGKIRY